MFATADLPWYAPSGGTLRDLATYRAADSGGELTLVCFPIWNMPGSETPLHGARVLPAPWPSTLRGRLSLRLAATLRGRMVFQEHLARRGAMESLVEVLREVQPDVLVLGHPLYDGFLPIARPLVPRLIVDLWEMRVEGARRRVRTGVDWGRRGRALLDLLVLDRIEREVARYADEVWMVDEVDAERYSTRYGIPARAIPTTIDVGKYSRYHALPRAPDRFGFVGILYYDPNITAALRLMKRILPLVRQRRPDATVSIIGRKPLPTLRAAVEETPGAILRPDVEDAMEELAHAGILVAPMESGTGMRVKLLEAAASRVPIITTRMGLSGVTFVPDREVLVAETDAEFADSIVRLWEDPEFASTLTAAAYDRVRSDYDTSGISQVILRGLRGEPEPGPGSRLFGIRE